MSKTKKVLKKIKDAVTPKKATPKQEKVAATMAATKAEKKPDIHDLTPEQEQIMKAVAKEYETIALGGKDDYDEGAARRGLEFVYKLAELKLKEIIYCDSPLDMMWKAGLKEGDTFDAFGIGYDAGWTAFYDFAERIGVAKYDPKWGFDIWKDFIRNSGVFATKLYDDGRAYVCRRPTVFRRNAAGELHAENGMAIAWRDNYGEYFLNGVPVEEWLVMTPAEKIDPTVLTKETNAEVRREIVRKVGIDRVLSKCRAEVIDTYIMKSATFTEQTPDGRQIKVVRPESKYELVVLDLGDNRRRPFLKMANPSLPGVWHIEGVPPETKTVKEALKFRNGREDEPIALT